MFHSWLAIPREARRSSCVKVDGTRQFAPCAFAAERSSTPADRTPRQSPVWRTPGLGHAQLESTGSLWKYLVASRLPGALPVRNSLSRWVSHLIAVDLRCDLVGRLRLHRRRHMRVDVESDTYAGVTETLLNHARMNVAAER
jgi:hypothetical protein